MRAPEDMPRTRRPMGRGRIIVIAAAAMLLILLTSTQELSIAFTDYLWFDSVAFTQVWKNILFTKIALAVAFTVIFFLLLYVNLVIADRIAPKFRSLSPEDELLSRYQAMIERRAGWVRVILALAFGIMMGAGNSSQWEEWLLFLNGGDFGVTDATFNRDVGFYVFQLPFIAGVLNWLFAALVIVFLITAVAHYLNGGIRLQVAGDRVTPQVKRHLSLLLAAIALVKFAGYWFERFALTFSRDGTVDGATYTPVNAQQNAIYLLMFASAVAFVCFVINIWRKGWVLPIIAVGLWALVAVIAGEAYPALVQKFLVQPAESEKERPYIVNNIAATRQSYGLERVERNRYEFTGDLEATKNAAVANPSTVRNITLLDKDLVQPSYQQLQRIYDYYQFNDLDVDRYPMNIDGKTATQAVVIGARDLATDSNVVRASWENNRIAYTHGFGVALAAANATTQSGAPNFSVSDVPVNVDRDSIDMEITKPGVYFGERVPGYAITGAVGRNEVAYQGADNQTVEERYDGEGGVKLDSLIRRFAFYRRFGDSDILVSQFIDDQSRILFLRDVRERVQQAAPFITWDRDPYPVVANGRIVYIIDGFTSTPYYPNAQSWDSSRFSETVEPNSLPGRSFNYVRNSVKATVDAYDGKLKLYIWDEKDPIVKAYAAAFPDLFTDRAQLPSELLAHVRFPEDLFRVQTSMWGRYHLSDPKEFYQRSGAWSVAAEPNARPAAQGSQANQSPNQPQQPRAVSDTKIRPQYQEMRLPNETEDSFLAFRTFVPVSADSQASGASQKLTAFMVAKSDPQDYGRLISYELPSPPTVDGPTLVDSKIAADTDISREITLLNQNGSELQFGSMLLIPFTEPGKGDVGTFVYVRPLYVKAANRPVPELKKVIVSAGEGGDAKIVMRDTLKQALFDLLSPASTATLTFPTLEGAQDRPSTGGGQPTPRPATPPGSGTTTTSTSQAPTTTTTTVGGAGPAGDVPGLIADANRLLDEANQAMRKGDLATYQQKVDLATEKIRAANELTAANAATTTTATQSGNST